MVFAIDSDPHGACLELRRLAVDDRARCFLWITLDSTFTETSDVRSLGEHEETNLHEASISAVAAAAPARRKTSMDCLTCYEESVISLREARAIISQHVSVLPAESRPITDALGQVLRQDVVAPEDIPTFDRSAMDGYALLADDTSETLRVLGEATPGAIPEFALRPGECVRIFTGAAIPGNAGRVLPQEWVERQGDEIVLKRREGPDFIRKRGEDARQGDVLLSEGRRLGAGELSLLAQVGAVSPMVSRKPRVAHIATGNELVPPDQSPAPGQIRDSNSTLIAALLHQAGAELVLQDRCDDEVDKLLATIDGALERGCDLLLLSGGASVGDYDFGPRVLEKRGFTIHFRQMDLKPGKPLVFATNGNRAAFVVPGNPVSHFVTFHVGIRVTLERMQGAEPSWPFAAVQLLSSIPAQRDPRETYWPARVGLRAGRLCAEPLKWQSSGDLRGLAGANGLLQVLPGTTPVEAGGELSCLLLEMM